MFWIGRGVSEIAGCVFCAAARKESRAIIRHSPRMAEVYQEGLLAATVTAFACRGKVKSSGLSKVESSS
jgi:hypothetical protein